MSIVLGLPKYVSYDILEVWLDLMDLGNLDSALTQTSDRQLYLSVVSDLRYLEIDECTVTVLNWVYLRSIKPYYVFISNEFIIESKDVLLKIKCDHIQRVTIRANVGTLLAPYIKSFLALCSRLTEIDINHVKWLNGSFQTVPSITPNFWSADCVPSSLLVAYKSLTCLNTRISVWKEDQIKEFLSLNPQLKAFSFKGPMNLLHCFRSHPNIEQIDMTVTDEVRLSSIAELLHNRPKIIVLRVVDHCDSMECNYESKYIVLHLTHGIHERELTALLDRFTGMQTVSLNTTVVMLGHVQRWLAAQYATLTEVIFEKVEDSVVKEVLTQAPGLEIFQCDYCTASIIKLLCTYGAMLKSLEVGCTEEPIGYESLKSIVRACPELQDATWTWNTLNYIRMKTPCRAWGCAWPAFLTLQYS